MCSFVKIIAFACGGIIDTRLVLYSLNNTLSISGDRLHNFAAIVNSKLDSHVPCVRNDRGQLPQFDLITFYRLSIVYDVSD